MGESSKQNNVLKKKTNRRNDVKGAGKEEPLFTAAGKLVQLLWKGQWRFGTNLKLESS